MYALNILRSLRSCLRSKKLRRSPCTWFQVFVGGFCWCFMSAVFVDVARYMLTKYLFAEILADIPDKNPQPCSRRRIFDESEVDSFLKT